MRTLFINILILSVSLSCDLFSQSRIIEPKKKDTQFERSYIEASKYKITRDYQKALELFNDLLKAHPDEAIVHYEIARIYWAQRKYKLAEQPAMTAYELSPNADLIKKQVLQILLKNKNYEGLCSFYEDRINDEPKKVIHYQKLASYQVKKGDEKTAWKTYTSIEKQFNRPDISYPQKADILLRQGDSKKAIKLLEKLISLYPNNIAFIKKLSLVLKKENQLDKARECYYEIIHIDSTDAYANAQLIDEFLIQKDTLKYFSALLLSLDNKQITEKRAIEVFSIIDRIDPQKYKQTTIVAEKTYQLYPTSTISISYADFLMNQNKDYQALKILESSKNSLKTTSTYLHLKMALLTKLHRSQILESTVKKYQTLYPSNSRGFIFLAIASCLEKKSQEAQNYIQKARKACFGDIEQLNRVESAAYLLTIYDGNYNSAPPTNQFNQYILHGDANYFKSLAMLENKDVIALKKLLETNRIRHKEILNILISTEDQTQKLAKLIISENQLPAPLFEYIGDYFASFGKNELAIMYWNIAQPYIRSDRIQTKKDDLSEQ